MKTKYSKAFEKYYAKRYPNLVKSDGQLDDHLGELLKQFAFVVWSDALKKVDGRMKYVRKCADGHYQHEDFDYLHEWVRSLHKDE